MEGTVCAQVIRGLNFAVLESSVQHPRIYFLGEGVT